MNFFSWRLLRLFHTCINPLRLPGAGNHTIAGERHELGVVNSNEIGWIGNDCGQIAAQKAGQALWPPIDMDRSNPTGVENAYPVATAGGR